MLLCHDIFFTLKSDKLQNSNKLQKKNICAISNNTLTEYTSMHSFELTMSCVPSNKYIWSITNFIKYFKNFIHSCYFKPLSTFQLQMYRTTHWWLNDFCSVCVHMNKIFFNTVITVIFVVIITIITVTTFPRAFFTFLRANLNLI